MIKVSKRQCAGFPVVMAFACFILILFTSSRLFSQPCFEKFYGGALQEKANYVIQTSDNGYLLAGSRKDTAFNTRAYFLLKLDSLGKEMWSASYGDARDQEASAVIEIPDSGYVFIGTHHAVIYNTVAEIVKTDYSGNKKTVKAFPPADGWGTNGIGIVKTADTNFAITIFTDGFISQNFYSILKIAPDLSTQWSNFVSFDGSLMNVHDAVQAYDKSFYTLGFYPDFFYVSPSISNVTEVRKLASNGSLIFDSLYLWNSVSKSVSPNTDGGAVVCGYVDTSGNRDIALTRIDSNGAVLWNKRIGGTRNETGLLAKETPDGGYAILSSTPHAYFPLLNDILLTKTNANGDSLWSRSFGGYFNDDAVHFEIARDGGFIILGSSNSFDSSGIYLVKTDSIGIIRSPYSIASPGNYHCRGDSIRLTLNPHPGPGSTVHWSNGMSGDSIRISSTGNYRATVIDSSGKVIETPNHFLFFANITDANISTLDTFGICAGSQLKNLAPASPSFSYRWFLDDTLLTGITSNALIPSRPGEYKLQVMNYCGMDIDSVFIDSLYPLPSPPVLSRTGNVFICEADTIELFTNPLPGHSYQWWYAPNINASPIAGATDSVLSLSLPGTYFVQVTESHGCTSTSNPLNIFIDNFPSYVNVSGPLTFCQGGHVLLAAPTGRNYRWNTGDTLGSISVKVSGSYWYSMTSMFGCPKTSDTVVVDVLPRPFVNLGPDTVICRSQQIILDPGPGYSSVIWQDNIIAQSILAEYKPGGPDSAVYIVRVTDQNNCMNTDSIVVFFDICQNVSGFENPSISIHAGILTEFDFVRINSPYKENLEMKIMDQFGRLLQQFPVRSGQTIQRLNLSKSGIYYYSLVSESRLYSSGKLLLMR
ncbi:MAG: T9SS C-terminal target domain-containing protein [Bacteroidetes bacterium]|nr:MAG: T9SS C-terminal target domain-containing protein [Bacteroidota bacterium]REK06619.1 MAG: T9SS C-terminal target domain-containing protein [Bacteroidota bacterium]REK33385.1 MAG: T9SS C-terminal target domain-containing protein [Bacteroidota bacterium]REK49784.1 MAG: T9SS C-terminal target domain-containing protein [Bacteroidota bacterium]